MSGKEVHLREQNPAKDARYGNVIMFLNPQNGAMYTRKEKVFETEAQ